MSNNNKSQATAQVTAPGRTLGNVTLIFSSFFCVAVSKKNSDAQNKLFVYRFTAMSQPTTPRPTSEVPTTYSTPPEDNNTASPKQQLATQPPPPPTPTSASSEHHPLSQYPPPQQDDQHRHNTQQLQAELSSSSVYPPDANALARRPRKESVYFQDDSPVFTATRYKGNIYAMDRSTM